MNKNKKNIHHQKAQEIQQNNKSSSQNVGKRPPLHPAIAHARRELIQALDELPYHNSIIVAVSGGSDSTALAHVARFVAQKKDLHVAVVIVDHGLRRESKKEAMQVYQRMHDLGFDDVDVVNADVYCYLGGPEGSARSARYDILADASQEYDNAPVLLGHTADDQAETVLLGFGRGSGARSIAGMKKIGTLPEHDDIPAIRPLLDIRRKTLRKYLRSEGIEWVDDPTNSPHSDWKAADGTPVKRNAVRHQVLPAMKKVFGDACVDALGRTALQLQQDNAALDMWAQEEYDRIVRIDSDGDPLCEPEKIYFDPGVLGPLYEGVYAYDTEVDNGEEYIISASHKDLEGLPIAIRTRVIRAMCLSAGALAGSLKSDHIETLNDFVMGEGRKKGQRMFSLPTCKRCKLTAYQNEGRLYVKREKAVK